MWLLFLFVVMPIVEIALFLQVGGLIGFWPTIGLVILGAVAGSVLMRRQGAAAMADLQGAFRDLRDPTGALAHGALIVLAGALMMAPGFFSDILGILLLIPAVRRWAIRRMRARMTVTRAGFGMGGRTPPGRDWPPRPGGAGGLGTVIDADFIVVEDEPAPGDPPPPSGPRRPTRGGPSGWTRH